MESANNGSAQLQGTTEQYTHYSQYTPGLLLSTVLILGAIIFFIAAPWKKPRSILDPVPYLFNTIQFIFYNAKFQARAKKALRSSRLAKFYLFTTPVYLVSGRQNIQTIFGGSHRVGNENLFTDNAFPKLYCMSKEECQRFVDDTSGRGHVPAPGSEHIPDEHRYWHGYDYIHSEYLGRVQHLRPMAEYFRKRMTKMLDEQYALGESTTLSVIDFCKGPIAHQSIESMFGPRLFELSPNVLEAFWEFDRNIIPLTLGIPKWMYSVPHTAQERYYGMIRKYLDEAKSGSDSESADADWDVNFGARVCREVAKWVREKKFSDEVAVGAMAMLVFAALSNSMPITMWMIIEVVKDPALLEAVREEVATACTTDPDTGSRTVIVEKIVTLPLLQSIFTEILRLRVNFNLMRNVKEPITLDGFTLQKGSLLQAPSVVAHFDEAAWASEGHPATEFWAERHIKYQEETDEAGNITRTRKFAMAARPSEYFPFGGGHSICPGRHFAKQEILTATALLISKFDIEVVGWTKFDKSPSDRPAEDDIRFSGAGAQPPDRDLKISLKRLA